MEKVIRIVDIGSNAPKIIKDLKGIRCEIICIRPNTETHDKQYYRMLDPKLLATIEHYHMQ